jgi:HSP20 family protein
MREFSPSSAPGVSIGAPAADVLETGDALLVMLDLPGHAPEQLQVKLEDQTLTITSERKLANAPEEATWLRRERSAGSFTRSFKLPPTVDGARVDAKFEHGVLTITLPKREETKPRVIEVKVRGE